jgi:hypothetical protein
VTEIILNFVDVLLERNLDKLVSRSRERSDT